ncbi:hypothetical protein SOVF_176980 [Spinacia oleracea]|nr:hypothetical protein SOVF_176980 [Spinacia oleracea]
MCHKAGFPLPSLEGLVTMRTTERYILRRPPPLMVEPAVNQQQVAADVAAGGGGERRRVCLCSPTSHPGSFRCRYHHSDYVWCSMKLSPRFQF